MKKNAAITLSTLVMAVLLTAWGFRKTTQIPRVWDKEKLESQHLPLPNTTVKVQPVAEDYYYKLPERKIYKTYPFYMPGREPKDYYNWLRNQDPEIILNADTLTDNSDWIKAGAIIFDMPTVFNPMDSAFIAGLPAFGKILDSMHYRTDKDGTIPYISLIVRQKGKIELGRQACNNCHSKLMPDGSLLKGGQGDFVFTGFGNALIQYDRDYFKVPDSILLRRIRGSIRLVFEAPYLQHNSQDRLKKMTVDEWLASFGTPTGVFYRQGSGYGYPVSIPDLFNLKERKYLDRTGAMQQRDIGDMERYATINQSLDLLDDYHGFTPTDRPADPAKGLVTRFSDAQLYALAQYIYSIKTPVNPNPASAGLIRKGAAVFAAEGCADCHKPPLYSGNQLTPADGFEPPADHFSKYTIKNESVGTDPGLTLYTRRGSGYYKVPSLIGAWNRTAFLHSGYLARLEDMFDSTRFSNNYAPTGFKPAWLDHMAIKGHPFGTRLNEKDKASLVAFVKSL